MEHGQACEVSRGWGGGKGWDRETGAGEAGWAGVPGGGESQAARQLGFESGLALAGRVTLDNRPTGHDFAFHHWQENHTHLTGVLQ